MTKYLCVLTLSFCISGFAHAALPDAIAQPLRAAGISQNQVALWVAPAAGGASSMQHNIAEPLNPASVMKIVTSSAALEILGPSFSWSTDAILQGELKDGVLNGNLVLRGGGDPALTWDRFGAFLRDLRSRGLREIRGDLIVDRSLFANQPQDDFDDQPQRAYNATPDALLVNFKAISVRLTPTQVKQAVSVASLVPLAPFVIDNKLMTTAGSCGDWRGNLRGEFTTGGDALHLKLTGSLPASCGEKTLNLAMHDGLRMTGSVFRALWQELGGTLTGSVKEAAPGSILAIAPVFASWRSPTLAEVLRDMNKYSNNVMARHVFLTLGMGEARTTLTPQQGEARIREWLTARNLALPGLVLENGSGLSRRERITAGGLGSVLQAMWASPRMPDFVATLPIAGEDGTAKRRFGGQSGAGRAYLKTGSLNDVMSTAGYILDASGQWQAFVLIINGPRAELGEPASIAAVNLVAQGNGPRSAAR